MKKIVIIGTSGSGKTTLGKQLSSNINASVTDLDDLYWLPEWKNRKDEFFLKEVSIVLSTDKWIVCGNYSRVQREIWSQADTIIWIDLPLRTCLYRVLKRSLSRILTKQACCNGNYETIKRLMGKESLLLWIWNTYSRRKKTYSEYFSNQCDVKHLVRLKSTSEISAFIKKEITNLQ